jgi:hypothetical protein
MATSSVRAAACCWSDFLKKQCWYSLLFSLVAMPWQALGLLEIYVLQWLSLGWLLLSCHAVVHDVNVQA